LHLNQQFKTWFVVNLAQSLAKWFGLCFRSRIELKKEFLFHRLMKWNIAHLQFPTPAISCTTLVLNQIKNGVMIPHSALIGELFLLNKNAKLVLGIENISLKF
jgi:uncharacterized membrane protein